MIDDWRVSTIENEADILLGFAFKSAEFADKPPGCRLVRGDNVKRGMLEWGEKSRYWRNATDSLEKYNLRVGDIVIGMDGSRVGENFACVSPNDLPALLVQRVACLRGKEGLDQSFLRYLIFNQSFTAYIKAVHTGTSIPHISGSQIGAYQIRVPPLAEQRAIAHILGTLDDKIELNRQINETLEEMARALFKSWFVDFDPIHAKMSMKEPFLSPEIWKLFPDKLGNNGIPEGWRQSTLAEFAVLNPESWSKKNNPSNIEYVDLANTKWGVIESTPRMPWTEAPSRAQRILRYGDTIMGMVRPGNGSYAFIGREGLTGSTGFAVLRPKKDSYQGLIFLAATSKSNIDRLAHLADGAAYPAIRPEVILATPIIVPENNLQKSILDAFSKLTKAPLDSIELRKNDSQIIANIRDALLPKLISGQIRIKEAEKLLESHI